jgi:alpha-glucan,water dikinase
MFKLQNGEIYLLIIELRDPNIHAIEFVLKDGNRDRWLVLFSRLSFLLISA